MSDTGDPHTDLTWLHTYPVRAAGLEVGVVAVRGQLLPAIRCDHDSRPLTEGSAQDLISALRRSLAVVNGRML
jgi:hypothetical protein